MAAMTEMPQIGYGTWNRDGQAAYDGVAAALDVGYRHIDTAEGYNNEEFVGAAIAESGVARDDIWLTTKVAPESFGPGQVRGHVEASLEKLRVDQVDLLLLHYPSIGDEYDIKDYMAQFAAVLDDGLTARLGVSNFTKRYIDAGIELLGEGVLFTNQVEIHPLMQNGPIVRHCRKKGIGLTAYSPLARGKVASQPLLQSVAADHNATPAQVSLAFLMAEGFTVVPSAGSPARIAENFAAQNVYLTDVNIECIQAMDAGLRLVDGPWCPKWDRS